MQSIHLASWWFQIKLLLDNYDSTYQNTISGIDKRLKSEMRMERHDELCVEKIDPIPKG